MFIENRMLIRATCYDGSTYTGTLYETTIQPDEQDGNKPHIAIFIDQDERFMENEDEFGMVALLADSIKSIEILDDETTQKKIKDENEKIREQHKRKAKKILYYDATKYPKQYKIKSRNGTKKEIVENGTNGYQASYRELGKELDNHVFEEIQIFASEGTFYYNDLDDEGNYIKRPEKENCWLNLSDYHLVPLILRN